MLSKFSFKIILLVKAWFGRRGVKILYGINQLQKKSEPLLINMVRQRNEALIIWDTLEHLSKFSDGIVVFDDASTDNSLDIILKHPSVLKVVKNIKWKKNREQEETQNRALLLQETKEYSPQWIMYSDADERFEGDIRSFLKADTNGIDGIRISLFDAYITEDDKAAYSAGPLYNFRRFFGPECRKILMIWRNNSAVCYKGLDQRQPKGVPKEKIITNFSCQHYGKSISISQWEETCDYYARFFPKYSKKWQARKGQAVHAESDFGRKLYSWAEVKEQAIEM